MFSFQPIKDFFKRVFTKETGQRILGFLLLRLQEPTTWRGIVLVLTATGTSFTESPEMATAVITFGMLAAGLIGMVFPDAVKQAEKVDHAPRGGFGGGYGGGGFGGRFGHGGGNQVVDTPDDDDEGDTAPPSQRAPR